MTKGEKRSTPLDLLRIFAAFWVLCVHWFTCRGCDYNLRKSRDISWVPDLLHAFSQWGILGVDIFFILSGSLIAKSALSNQWYRFAGNRFMRLFPTYFFVGLLSLFIYPLATTEFLTVDKIFSLSGLQLWIGGPPILRTGWTLAVEITFYFLVTVALYLSRGKKSFDEKDLKNFINIWLLFSVISTVMNFQPLQVLFVTSFAPYFILGASLSLVKDLPSFHANAITIFISGVLTLKDVLIRVETIPPLSHKFLGSILLILTTSAVIVFSNRNPSGEPTNIISRSLPVLSKMTYPIYLLHFEVGLSLIYFSVKVGLTSKEAFLASFVGILIISFLLVKIIEPRCNKYIRKYLLNFERK